MTRYFKTAKVGFGHYGFTTFQIEARALDDGQWQQRHIWYRADGSTHIEDWIPSRASFWRDQLEVSEH